MPNNIRGHFEKNQVEVKLKEIENLQKENFWKDKEIVKKTVKKKIFENILFSYRNSSLKFQI